VHHGNAVGDDACDGEIVRDEDKRHPQPPPEVAEQVENTRGDRDIERRRRLVAEQEAGWNDDRTCDRDTLALAARKLRRPGLEQSLGKSHHLHGVEHLRPTLRAARARGAQPLSDQVADREPRCQGGARVLEDHLWCRVADLE
jgi:hypothetical protein